MCCSGSTLDGVCERQLETVVPRPGEMVLMLRGERKTMRARLMHKDTKVLLLLLLLMSN